MDVTSGLVTGGIGFGRTVIGIAIRPYETYRRIIEHGSAYELFFIALLLILYFGFSALVKVNLYHPFLLTRQFVLLSISVGVSYWVALLLFWNVGRAFGGKGIFSKFALAWGYTLFPTLVWFLVTSILYVILPPPRTNSIAGIVFSLLFLVFSAVLFFWKAQLMYLSLRFGLRLDFPRIAGTVLVVVPLLVLYSVLMYRIGVFKIPFV